MTQKIERENERGFGLISIMFAVLISFILTISVYKVYKTMSDDGAITESMHNINSVMISINHFLPRRDWLELRFESTANTFFRNIKVSRNDGFGGLIRIHACRGPSSNILLFCIQVPSGICLKYTIRIEKLPYQFFQIFVNGQPVQGTGLAKVAAACKATNGMKMVPIAFAIM